MGLAPLFICAFVQKYNYTNSTTGTSRVLSAGKRKPRRCGAWWGGWVVMPLEVFLFLTLSPRPGR
ncbi:hypothetical protein [Vibrio phage VP882]|uniref:Uncharacterized protein n=1 Tax=Vibrio phage VP882 TaxID=2913982 RepID=A2I2Z2_9CAUD|nr:hypothetical protein VPVV882_gp42 [Vibrio phage VP882]ABM73406.1 hypothetical protein [Vibrio phage VP882]